MEYFQNCDFKNESFIVPIKSLGSKDQDLKTQFWVELESWLKAYQDSSDRHKILYSHTKIIRDQLLKNQNLDKQQQQKKLDLEMYNKTKLKVNDFLESNEFETEKLSKRKRFTRDINPNSEKSLLEFWANILNDRNKLRNEFYGRVSNPTDLAPLYQNLKIDENPLPLAKSIG